MLATLTTLCARCESQCVDPCSVLNGDVLHECGGCVGSHFRCKVGAPELPWPQCPLPPEPTQPGLKAALAAAVRQPPMRYECDSLDCRRVRSRKVQSILSTFDRHSGRSTATAVRNRSSIGFLVLPEHRYGGVKHYACSCHPASIYDRSSPWWLRAIRTRPDFVQAVERVSCTGFGVVRNAFVPHFLAIAAYLAFVMRVDVRLLTCDDTACLEGSDGIGTLIVRTSPPLLTHRVATNGPTLRDVCYALLQRLEASGVRTFPDAETLEWAYSKRRYYARLRDAHVPTAPYLPWTHPTTATAMAGALLATGWRAAMAKPAWQYDMKCGFNAKGIALIELEDGASGHRAPVASVARELRDVLEACDAAEHADVTLQRYEASIGENFEVRSFWYAGRYSHSIATRSTTEQALSDNLAFVADTFVDEFVVEGSSPPRRGTLPLVDKSAVLELGRRTLAALPRALDGSIPLIRVDAVCCLNGTEGAATRGWFVNELETLPDMLLDVDGFPDRSVARTAEAYLNFAFR